MGKQRADSFLPTWVAKAGEILNDHTPTDQSHFGAKN